MSNFMNFSLYPVWVNAMIATFIVSLLPNVLLVLLPEPILQDGKKSSKAKRSLNFSKMLLMFAVAGLLGDVFLHTLPHMLAPHHHHHAHDNDAVENVMLKSVHSAQLGTCDITKSCKLETDHHDEHHKYNEHDHSNHEHHSEEEGGHHHETILSSRESNHYVHNYHHDDDHIHKHQDEGKHDHNHSDSKPLLEKEVWAPLLLLIGFLAFFLAEKIANSFLSTNHNHDHSNNQYRNHSHLKAAGWLNLIADSLHNFTDGITIGAAFASGRGLGLAAFLSVVIHEVPHEISDFIILIRSGMTKWQAIRAQFVTALAAFLGTALGLYLSENDETVQTLLLAITGGGFVYIATVNVMPQIIAAEDTENESLGLLQVIGEVFCFALGVGLMIAVAQLEEHEH